MSLRTDVKQSRKEVYGLLRRFTPRNDGGKGVMTWKRGYGLLRRFTPRNDGYRIDSVCLH